MNVTPRLKSGVLPTKFISINRSVPSSPLREHNKKTKIDEMPSTSYQMPSTSYHIPVEVENINPTDKAVQVKPHYRSKGTNTTNIITKNTAVSPIKNIEMPAKSSSSMSTSTTSSPLSDFIPTEYSETTEVSQEESADDTFKRDILRCTLGAIERQPRLLLGIPRESFFVIQILTEEIAALYRNIMITLKKIRLNDSYAILALAFGMSASNISRIFAKTVVLIAEKLKQLIYWPEKDSIRMHLPIAFRARYKNVATIIDCFEIQIEKPSNPLHQSLTWSSYKGCNTLKYLISCTPDGLVNFISCGYGGRASDLIILQDCDYLDHLKPGMAVMADRGFKNVSHLIQAHHCTLVRPPSVTEDVPSTKEEVKESKRIAALRVHVERVIGRLREFKILVPHACVDNHLVPYMDIIVTLACGLINLQDHLIK